MEVQRALKKLELLSATPRANLKAYTRDGFCSWSMLQSYFARRVKGESIKLQELAPYYNTHEGAFSSLLNLPRELAPKYLTDLIS